MVISGCSLSFQAHKLIYFLGRRDLYKGSTDRCKELLEECEGEPVAFFGVPFCCFLCVFLFHAQISHEESHMKLPGCFFSSETRPRACKERRQHPGETPGAPQASPKRLKPFAPQPFCDPEGETTFIRGRESHPSPLLLDHFQHFLAS